MICRSGVAAFLLVLGLSGYGCASHATNAHPGSIVSAADSPVALEVSPADAWRHAEAYVAAHPDCEPFVGRGDSMLPLYRDRTVLVVKMMTMSELRQGMTVVFFGDQGRPVAHVLVKRTTRGWVAMGLKNHLPDLTHVRADNYLGTVVRAFAPNEGIAAGRVDVPTAEAGLIVRAIPFTAPPREALLSAGPARPTTQ